MRNAPAMHGNDHIPGGPDPIVPFPEGVKWAAGWGFFCSSGAESTSTTRFIDLDTGVTNAPDVFTISTGQNGALGMAVLTAGIYRVWSDINFHTAYNGVANAWTYTAEMVFDWVNYYSVLNNTMSGGCGQPGSGSPPTANFNCSLHGDVFIYPYEGVGAPAPPDNLMWCTTGGPPYNVYELGMRQNTTFGGCWELGVMIQQLHDDTMVDGDFSDITYLPPP